MTDLDSKIRQALEQEERELFDQYADEMGLQDQIAATFQGKFRNLVVLVWLLSFALFGFVVFSGYQLYNALAVADAVVWSALFIVAVIMLSMMKIWYWMQMNRTAAARDIKRLELQLLTLNRQLDAGA